MSNGLYRDRLKSGPKVARIFYLVLAVVYRATERSTFTPFQAILMILSPAQLKWKASITESRTLSLGPS